MKEKQALVVKDNDGHMKAWAPKQLEETERDSW
jgi:hypothetical protein